VSAPRPSGAAASRLDRVNIIGTAATTNLVLASLLDRMGYLQHFGLEPRIVNVADGNKVVAALISGEVDICPLAGFTQVLAAVARGAPLKVIGGGANKNFSAVFTRLPTARTLKDLEGHSVGVGALGTQLHQIMLALFRKYGVDASKVTFANIGASVDVFKAVKAGIVDAGPAEVWLPHGAELHILEHGKVYESLPEFLSQTAFTSTRAIAQRRDILVRTLAAYARLYRFVMSPDSQPDFIAAGLRALGPRQLDLVHGSSISRSGRSRPISCSPRPVSRPCSS